MSCGTGRRAFRTGAATNSAEAKGKTITVADANYLIDKALAAGVLDANGDLDFKVKGTRDECIEQIIETSAMWESPNDGR